MTFIQYTLDEDGTESTEAVHKLARVIVPNNLGDLNLVHGVVKITEGMTALDR